MSRASESGHPESRRPESLLLAILGVVGRPACQASSLVRSAVSLDVVTWVGAALWGTDTDVPWSSPSIPGFNGSEDCAALEQLLEGYDQQDQDQVSEVCNSPLFKYMDNDVSPSLSGDRAS